MSKSPPKKNKASPSRYKDPNLDFFCSVIASPQDGHGAVSKRHGRLSLSIPAQAGACHCPKTPLETVYSLIPKYKDSFPNSDSQRWFLFPRKGCRGWNLSMNTHSSLKLKMGSRKRRAGVHFISVETDWL